jgi:hypothetical protein
MADGPYLDGFSILVKPDSIDSGNFLQQLKRLLGVIFNYTSQCHFLEAEKNNL